MPTVPAQPENAGREVKPKASEASIGWKARLGAKFAEKLDGIFTVRISPGFGTPAGGDTGWDKEKELFVDAREHLDEKVSSAGDGADDGKVIPTCPNCLGYCFR